MTCRNIEFTFEDVGIDFSDKDTNVFTINTVPPIALEVRLHLKFHTSLGD